MSAQQIVFKIALVALIWGAWRLGEWGYRDSVRNDSSTGTLAWIGSAFFISGAAIALVI